MLSFLSLFVILSSFAEVQSQRMCWWPQREPNGLWHSSLHRAAHRGTSLLAGCQETQGAENAIEFYHHQHIKRPLEVVWKFWPRPQNTFHLDVFIAAC